MLVARVTVAPEVALDWRRGEGEVRLVLSSDADLATAFAAMRSASDAVRSSYVIEMREPTVLPFGVGLFVVMDPPQYEASSACFVSRLEAMGISRRAGVTCAADPRAAPARGCQARRQ